MAGLAAAWMCRRAGRDVTVFEAQARRGMDAHTLEVAGPGGLGVVDVPLRVMSPRAWQSVLALCAEVGVETFEVDTFASFTWGLGGAERLGGGATSRRTNGEATWLRTAKGRLGPWTFPSLGSARFINGATAAVGAGLARLALDEARGGVRDETLAAYAERARLPRVFLRAFLLPLLTTICTCDEATLLAWPARDLLALFHRILLGEALRRLYGGTPALVDGLAAGLEIRAPERVVAVEEAADGVTVATASGWSGTFDHVLVATQANHAIGFLGGDGFARERATLARFGYDDGELVVHRDARFMPPRRDDWVPLNYRIARDLSASMFTVWVNPIEPSIGPELVLQTWNPLLEPDPAAVLARVKLQRAVVSVETAAAQRDLEALHAEPGRRVYFCGSWAAPGVPLLESAVRSAVAVARRLGVDAPWDPLAR